MIKMLITLGCYRMKLILTQLCSGLPLASRQNLTDTPVGADTLKLASPPDRSRFHERKWLA